MFNRFWVILKNFGSPKDSNWSNIKSRMWFAKWLSNQNTFVESRRKLFGRTWWTRYFVDLSAGLFKYKITNKTYSKNKNKKCYFNFAWSNESSRYQLSQGQFYYRCLKIVLTRHKFLWLSTILNETTLRNFDCSMLPNEWKSSMFDILITWLTTSGGLVMMMTKRWRYWQSVIRSFEFGVAKNFLVHLFWSVQSLFQIICNLHGFKIVISMHRRKWTIWYAFIWVIFIFGLFLALMINKMLSFRRWEQYQAGIHAPEPVDPQRRNRKIFKSKDRTAPGPKWKYRTNWDRAVRWNLANLTFKSKHLKKFVRTRFKLEYSRPIIGM